MAIGPREAQYDFRQLWRDLHFSHIAAHESAQRGIQTSYWLGLKPYGDLLQSLIDARHKRRDMMTFLCEPVPPADCPQRIRLEPEASVATIDLPRRSIQVVRNWPSGIPTEGGLTVFDESSEEYIKITGVRVMDDGAVHIESPRSLSNKDSLLVKGRPLRVDREYLDQLPEFVLHRDRRVPISASQSRAASGSTRVILHVATSDLEPPEVICDGKKLALEDLKSWRPESPVDLYDGSEILMENWRGQKNLTVSGQPKSQSLVTSSGVAVRWAELTGEGVWVRLHSTAGDDATVDPVEAFLDDTELDSMNANGGGRFRIINRRRELRMVLLDEDPGDSELYVWVRDVDVRNQYRAVDRLQQAPLEHHLPLMELTRRIDGRYGQAWPVFDPGFPNASWFTRVGGNTEGSNEQREFVRKALATPEFAFLEGPPGSGKTETIGELILQLLADPAKNMRILLCGSTQASIDNVLSRFGDHDLVQPLRIVNTKRWRDSEQDSHQIVYDAKVHQWVEPEQVDGLRETLGSLGERYTDEELGEFVRSRANLVCATIDGVAQIPEILESLKDRMTPPRALFDVLIIDEASKTTFPQFLVPAIFCRRWVLVGDVAQLPPFASTEDIADLLNLLESSQGAPPSDHHRIACLRIYQVLLDRTLDSQPPPWRGQRNLKTAFPRLLIEKAETVRALAKEWNARLCRADDAFGDLSLAQLRIGFCARGLQGDLESDVVSVDGAFVEMASPQDLGWIRLVLTDCDIIVVASDLLKSGFESVLPPSHIPSEFVGPDRDVESARVRVSNLLPSRLRRRIAVYRDLYGAYSESEQNRSWRDDPLRQSKGLVAWATTWGNEIAWRLQRVYEMQASSNQTLAGRYLQEVRSLLPVAGNAHWAEEAERIRCMLLPSILESLQAGFAGETSDGQSGSVLAPRVPTTLSQGFPGGAKPSRFETIPFQHRMHWDISRFPREQFYRPHGRDQGTSGERLKDAVTTLSARPSFDFLVQPPGVSRDAERRVFWVDVPDGQSGKQGNRTEAVMAKQIVADLMNWMASHPDRSEIELALVSPYVNQTQTMREMIHAHLEGNGGSLRGTRGRVRLPGDKSIGVFCSTIDKFQGQEADVVILSLRNVNRQGNIDSPNRANVALTRAREALFIVGHHQTYSNARDEMLRALAEGTPLGLRGRDWRAPN